MAVPRANRGLPPARRPCIVYFADMTMHRITLSVMSRGCGARVLQNGLNWAPEHLALASLKQQFSAGGHTAAGCLFVSFTCMLSLILFACFEV